MSCRAPKKGPQGPLFIKQKNENIKKWKIIKISSIWEIWFIWLVENDQEVIPHHFKSIYFFEKKLVRTGSKQFLRHQSWSQNISQTPPNIFEKISSSRCFHHHFSPYIIMFHVSCIIVSCIMYMHHVSCIMYYVLCVMYYVSCIMY